MLERYRTVLQSGSDELIIRKSSFIGHAAPVSDEAAALLFLAEIRKKHSSASHNCYAYVIGERDELQKQSDDGEPSGTAGRPIMDVLKHKQLKNTIIVVTRYFGGILLGAGGLVRAYSDGAVLAVAAAQPVEQLLVQEVLIEIEYTWLGKLENELRSRGVRTGETQFSDKVLLQCFPISAEASEFVAWMTDLTQGRAVIQLGDSRYVSIPLSE